MFKTVFIVLIPLAAYCQHLTDTTTSIPTIGIISQEMAIQHKIDYYKNLKFEYEKKLYNLPPQSGATLSPEAAYCNQMIAKSEKEISACFNELKMLALSNAPYNGNIQKAGEHLENAAFLTYGSIGISAIGSIITCVGLLSDKNGVTITGLVINIAGIVTNLFAPYQIYRAGNDLVNTTGLGK